MTTKNIDIFVSIDREKYFYIRVPFYIILVKPHSMLFIIKLNLTSNTDVTIINKNFIITRIYI